MSFDVFIFRIYVNICAYRDYYNEQLQLYN